MGASLPGVFERHVIYDGGTECSVWRCGGVGGSLRRSAISHSTGFSPGGRHRLLRQASAQGGRGSRLMAAAIPDPPTRPHPSSVERRSRGKWLQTAPQEPKSPSGMGHGMGRGRFSLQSGAVFPPIQLLPCITQHVHMYQHVSACISDVSSTDT